MYVYTTVVVVGGKRTSFVGVANAAAVKEARPEKDDVKSVDEDRWAENN